MVLDKTAPLTGIPTEVARWLGGALGIAAAGLFLMRGRLDKAVLGLRPVLDVALDVDNYLRQHPVDSTPRARIAERYASVLADIFGAAAGPPNERRYDALVIIAHSKGTVITADLLRYIRNHNLFAGNLGYDVDAGTMTWNAPIPVHLFTMGSPLRQLHQLRFPALYEWMGTAEAVDRGIIPPDAPPRVEELGVAAWVNVYRSGDYVGRQLWLDEAQCEGVYRRVGRRDDSTAADALDFATAPAAVDAGLKQSSGKFTSGSAAGEDVTLGDRGTTTSRRFNLGVSWFALGTPLPFGWW